MDGKFIIIVVKNIIIFVKFFKKNGKKIRIQKIY